MFFSNQFADRNFARRKFLAVQPSGRRPGDARAAASREFLPFFVLMLVHCLLYVPTISITNSIAFANMKDAQKEFGIVRMGGTIGWILAAWPFTFILVDWDKVDAAHPQGLVNWLGTVLANPLTGDARQGRHALDVHRRRHRVAGARGVQPDAAAHAAARSAARRGRPAWLEAFKLLKHPFVLVLWLVTLVDSFVHNCYFNWTGVFLGTARDGRRRGHSGNWIMPVMSIGQVAEILTMFVLGATLKRLGWRDDDDRRHPRPRGAVRRVRVLPASAGADHLVQMLHGICYAFFFATVYIFVDAYFPKDVRASAQGLFNVQILGIGALLANSICPWLIQNVYTHDGVTDFRACSWCRSPPPPSPRSRWRCSSGRRRAGRPPAR